MYIVDNAGRPDIDFGREEWRLQERKEGCVPSQRDRTENTGVLEDIRFMSDQIMYDTLSEGKR